MLIGESMRKVRLIIAATILAFGLALIPALPAAAQGGAGDAKKDVCAGIVAGGGACNNNGGQVNKLVKLIVNVISAIAGIAAVIMIIISGMKFITSSGDTSKVASAKNTIVYAIIGLVIVVFAQFIIRFVIDKAV
jgi:cytochrome bd-type quinol oxidase subunit 2